MSKKPTSPFTSRPAPTSYFNLYKEGLIPANSEFADRIAQDFPAEIEEGLRPYSYGYDLFTDSFRVTFIKEKVNHG